MRINDRGPFVANRIIDLSLAASQAIEMMGTGTAHVRLEIVCGRESRPRARSECRSEHFCSRKMRSKLKAQLEQTHPPASVVKFDSPKGMFYRVRVGRVPTEAEAQDLATKLHNEQGYTTFVVRLDD